ncbi:MFS transporter [Streptosporangium roseum]|uniref:MFS transporter n=1 Tax=Streptosporangium roseum TaxID=2001 RepID=UPI003326F515
MAQKWWTLTAVVTGVFMLVLDITIVNVALPYIGLDFHAPLSDLQWVIDAYALALAAGLLTGGSLGDLWGRRRLYAVGTAIFTVGSLLCGLATGPLLLSLARAGQGIGGAVVWATSLALLGDAFRGRDRGTAFGIYGGILGIAAGVLLVLFLVLEFKQKRPMLDMRLFRKPTFTGGLIAAFGLNASVYALFPYLVLYLQQQLGQSAAQAGMRFLALTAAMFVASTIAGRLTSTVPVRLMIGGGFVLIGVGILLMYGLTPSSGWTDLLPGMIISGAGAGMVTVPLASTAVGVVDVSQAGMASGINATARQVGIATGIAALGAIFTSQLRDTAADHLRDTPLAAQAQHLADGMGASTGPGDASLAGLPATAAELVDQAARTGFVDGLNLILVIGAAVAFVSALFSLVLIRRRDFVPPPAAPAPAAAASAAEAHGS